MARRRSAPADGNAVEQEARGPGALNHPHIGAIHDVGRQERRTAVARHGASRGRDARRATGARAAGAARRRSATRSRWRRRSTRARHGIVHRDLKPANVMMTTQGVVRCWISALRGSGRHRRRRCRWSTRRRRASRWKSDSTLLGSVHYLAPERLEGHDADASGDLFALGVVMYEMATGRRPFEGGSAAAVIAGILRSHQPPPSTVRPDVPPSLDWVIQKCLAKNPESRWQAAGDIVEVLRWLARAPAVDAAGQPRRRAWMLPVAAAAALAIAGSMFAAGRFSAARQTPVPPLAFAIFPPENGGFTPTPSSVPSSQFALSPDGRPTGVRGAGRDGSAAALASAAGIE